MAPKTETERVSYAWQTLSVDALALTEVAVAIGDNRNGGTWAGLAFATYLLGPPIVHGAHGHAGKAFGSFGLRIGVPLGGMAAGAAVGSASCGGSSSSGDGLCPAVGAVIGGLIGIPTAMIIDATALANEDVPKRREERSLRLTPTFVLAPGRAHAGVIGMF